MKTRRLVIALSFLLQQGASAASLDRIAAQAVGPGQLSDAAVADGTRLLLRGGLFDPLRERIDYAATGAAEDVAAARYALVQFARHTRTDRVELERRGLRVVAYVPNNAFVVALDLDHSLDRLAAVPGVRWSGYYQPGMKLDPALWRAARSRLPSARAGGYEIDVLGFAGESAERLAAALSKQSGVQVLRANPDPDIPLVRLHADAASLDALLRAASAEDGVAFVLPHYAEALRNSGGPPTIQGNTTVGTCGGESTSLCGPTPLWDHQLLGSGQILSISDSGLDANEAWFVTLDKGSGPHTEITFADATPAVPPALGLLHPDNKVIGYWVQPGADAYDNNESCTLGAPRTNFHGTHTSGTLAGDAGGVYASVVYTASTPTSPGHDGAEGMAPNAQILFQDIGDANGCLIIADLPATLQQAYAGGARVHSASWGNDNHGVYATDDLSVDRSLWNLEDLIFVVAAGNSGSGASTVGSPANAKNAITVGALNHAPSLSVAFFSSRGPTADGRIKPDVMAQGVGIYSASGDASTTSTVEDPADKSLDGTSMAAPTIAGNTALLRQYFTDGFYPRGARTAADTYNPSGMAMKAVLLNGTNPIGSTAFGGNTYGWGRAWLDGNLWFATSLAGGDDTRRLRLFERPNAAGLREGDAHEYTLASVGAGQELRATLTWYDPEAMPGNALSLVNDLDLEVVAPNGTYLGNVFAAGVSVTGGSADVRNSVEQVRLVAPMAGSYTFRVKGSRIPGNSRSNTSRQGYALAVSGAFGLPDAPAFAAPVATGATSTASTVQVAFTSAPGAQGFQLYRAPGTCASAAAGDFRLVGSGAASPLTDDSAQGGFAYAYRVRGIGNDVEGNLSNCVDTTAATQCRLEPTHAPDSLALQSNAGAACHLAVAWQAGSSNCPGADPSMTYTLQRASDPYFGDGALLVSGVSGTAYDDTSVAPGTPYYYRVQAVDSLGNTSPASRIAGGTPIGPNGLDGHGFVDDADLHAYLQTDTPWQITNTQKSNGSYSYHSAPDGATYPSQSCYSLTTPPLLLDPGAILNFKARYDLEYQWDGMVLEISTDDGANWSDLPPTGGYPKTLASTGSPPVNACGFPATQGVFTGVSTASSNANPNNGVAVAVFKPFSASLATYAGQHVRLRWRVTTDPGTEYEGVYIDEVSLSSDRVFHDNFDGDLPGPCSAAP